MHMEPNHEGRGKRTPNHWCVHFCRRNASIRTLRRLPASRTKKNRRFLHRGGCLLCDPGTGVRISLCLAGKPTGALSAVFPRRRRYNLRRLFLYDGLTLHAETEDLAAQEQLWLVGAFHGLRTLLCAVLKWSAEIFQPILLHDRDCVLDCSGVRLPLEPSLGRFVVPDLLDQLFRIPFSNFTCGPKILRGAAGKSRRSKNALAAVLGILVAIPLVMVVGTLLTRADQTFARMVQEMTAEFGERLLEFLLRLLPAALVGCYFFGMFYGNLQKRFVAVRGKEDVEKAREKRRKLPPAMTVTVLALLTGVYLLFFGAQAATLFSAFAGVRPEGLTYAEYARQGFLSSAGWR